MGKLNAVAGTPGLWQNPDWKPGTAGTFVMLIGVSKYSHLPGGDQVIASQNYGLGQLFVSALTAHELFSWVDNDYEFVSTQGMECPVAQCWLLCAPTDAEQERMRPEIVEHLLDPTFNNCVSAIRSWKRSMDELGEQGESSRLFFFFCGHGLEIYQEEQIVLPSDWLNPQGDISEAINVRKLARALSELKVNNQYFFVDACRNDHPKLRELDIKGSGVITSGLTLRANPECNAPILHASAASLQTFQPTDVQNGLSLFGQSLLDGLYARAGYTRDCGEGKCLVRFSPLHDYIIRRYNELLRQFGQNVRQTIPLVGQMTEPLGVVTQVVEVYSTAPPEHELTELVNAQSTTKLNVVTRKKEGGLISDNYFNRNHPEFIELAQAVDFNRYIRKGHSITFPTESMAAGTDRKSMSFSVEQLFASKRLAEMWQNAKVFSLRKRVWLDRSELLLERVERTANKRFVRITFSLPASEGGHWLEFSYGRNVYVAVLPDETPLYKAPSTVFYMLEVEANDRGFSSGEMIRFDVSFSPERINGRLISSITAVWDKYRNGTAFQASLDLEDIQLRGMVIGKADSLTVAALATLILIRAGKTVLLESYWMQNLMDWYPQSPDACVVRNEFHLRASADDPDLELLVANLAEMNRRGFPRLNECIGLALRQLSDILDLPQLPAHTRRILEDIHRPLRENLRWFSAGGMFTVFSVPREAIVREGLVKWFVERDSE